MSLFECPECGKHISSQASSCPECGWAMNSDRNIIVNVSQSQAQSQCQSQSEGGCGCGCLTFLLIIGIFYLLGYIIESINWESFFQGLLVILGSIAFVFAIHKGCYFLGEWEDSVRETINFINKNRESIDYQKWQTLLKTRGGKRWLKSQNGKDWLNSEMGKEWLSSDDGIKWGNSTGRMIVAHSIYLSCMYYLLVLCVVSLIGFGIFALVLMFLEKHGIYI